MSANVCVQDFFLDYVPGNEIAGYRMYIYSTLLDKSKFFSPVLIPI